MITTWFDDDPLFNRYYPYDSAYRYYFDHEWSLPTDQDTHLFEFLSLGGFAAGLSWSGVLKKRPALTTAFSDWQIDVVAAYDEAHITKLLANPQPTQNYGGYPQCTVDPPNSTNALLRRLSLATTERPATGLKRTPLSRFAPNNHYRGPVGATSPPSRLSVRGASHGERLAG